MYKVLLLFLIVASCTSCSTSRIGVYDIVYHKQYLQKYELKLMEGDHSVKLYVERNGSPVTEVELWPESIKVVASPFDTSPDNPDSMTILFEGTDMRSVYKVSDGTNVTTIIDMNGDGFPDRRITLGEDGRMRETVEQVFSASPSPKPLPPK